ncbi:hypothetical protein D3C86_1750610 [compost metagenome]
MISSARLGSKIDAKMISRYSSGIELQISIARCENRSKRPPKKPISAPVSVPTSTPMIVSAMPNSTDTRKP